MAAQKGRMMPDGAPGALLTTLAGRPIRLDLPAAAAALAEVMPLAEAVAAPDAAGLHLTAVIDPAAVDSALTAEVLGARHDRSGRQHRWRVQDPRQVQTLTLPDRDKTGPAHAVLTLPAPSDWDGTVRARPAVDAISAWAAAEGVLPLHAAGVVRDGRAVLFLGEGGRGKTTTALALAQQGWSFLADDRCFVFRVGAGFAVASLYASAILTPTSEARLNAQLWPALGPNHEGKRAHRLPTGMKMARTARLAGAIWVGGAEDLPYMPRPLGRRDALTPWQNALEPALAAHGPDPDWLRALGALSRGVPTWRMALGWEFDRIETALTALLEGGRAAR